MQLLNLSPSLCWLKRKIFATIRGASCVGLWIKQVENHFSTHRLLTYCRHTLWSADGATMLIFNWLAVSLIAHLKQKWNLSKESVVLVSIMWLILMASCCLIVWAVCGCSDKHIILNSHQDTDLLYLLQLEHFIEVPLPELWMSHCCRHLTSKD